MCSRCGQTKPIEQFRRSRRNPSGYASPCLECHRAANRQWRTENPELDRTIKRRYAETHVEYNRARGRRRYYENRDVLKAQQKAYAESHREERRAYKRAYDAKHRASHRTYNQVRRQNPVVRARMIANAKAWRENNRQRWQQRNNLASAKRRALLYQAPVNDLTLADWERRVAEFGGRCAYCGRQTAEIQQDHVVPVSRGGNHTRGNIVPACKPCNARKRDRTPQEAGMRFVIEPA